MIDIGKLIRHLRALFRRPKIADLAAQNAPEMQRRRAAMTLAAATVFGGAALTSRSAGAVSLPPAVLYDPQVNIKNFQVLGNGTDETAKIQAAINAAATDGTWCRFFPPGTYGISAQLTVPLGVSLLGVSASDDVANANTMPITRILALSAFPKSTYMLAFPLQWAARFENFVVDGGTYATCGIQQTSCRSSITRDIMITNLGNNGTSDAAILLTVSTSTHAQNLFERVTVNNYTIAAGTSGIVVIGTSSYQVTENTFISCNIGCGPSSSGALTLALYADNNWFFGCNFTGSATQIVNLNDGNVLEDVQENQFIGCSIVNTGTTGQAECVATKYNEDFNVFIGCYFWSDGSGPVYAIGTSGKLKFSNCNQQGALLQNEVDQSVSASPYTYTNNTPVMQMISIYAGTISGLSVTRNGSAHGLGTAALGWEILLQPTDSITITYSAAPVVQVFPQT